MTVSFEHDVKPLFRGSDRESMLDTFDLWSYEDVKENADDVLRVLGGVDAVRGRMAAGAGRDLP